MKISLASGEFIDLGLVEGSITKNGMRILDWLSVNKDKLDRSRMYFSPEPIRNAMTQAMEKLGIKTDPVEYLGYAIEEILYGPESE